MSKCEDCGLPYDDFWLDTTIPNSQWSAIHPQGEGGVLCANCMVKRASLLPGIIAARMVFEFAPCKAVEQRVQPTGGTQHRIWEDTPGSDDPNVVVFKPTTSG